MWASVASKGMPILPFIRVYHFVWTRWDVTCEIQAPNINQRFHLELSIHEQVKNDKNRTRLRFHKLM